MQVLGFTVVPAGKPPAESVKRRRVVGSGASHSRVRASRAVPEHRGRRRRS
jgi:hypothetical protein